MDLNTVRRNLTKGGYTTMDDFCSDIFLIWNNCKLYNEEVNMILIVNIFANLRKIYFYFF